MIVKLNNQIVDCDKRTRVQDIKPGQLFTYEDDNGNMRLGLSEYDGTSVQIIWTNGKLTSKGGIVDAYSVGSTSIIKLRNVKYIKALNAVDIEYMDETP